MSLTLNKILVLCALLISAMLPGWSWAESAWQDSSDTVGEFNGTGPPPTAPAYPSTRAVSFSILQRRMR